MKAAYVGILTPGSTSGMRARWLRDLTPEWAWEWCDTDPPLLSTGRIWRSLAYRAQSGRAVTRINEAITHWIAAQRFDLIWVDKAIFLWPDTVDRLRRSARRLVHFTPDTAFHANRSNLFENNIGKFDLLVTTKSFEVSEYGRRGALDRLLVTTQGYDPTVHFPRNPAELRERSAAFIGLAEPYREECVASLLRNGVSVRLGGRGWQRFLRAWRTSGSLVFEGEDVFGDDYATMLSRSWVGLGLVSKRFPELHTTRTFEIPACGAVVATEKNSDTLSFFAESEALFFDDLAELANSVSTVLSGSHKTLADLASAGRNRVIRDKRSYADILAAILADARIAV